MLWSPSVWMFPYLPQWMQSFFYEADKCCPAGVEHEPLLYLFRGFSVPTLTETLFASFLYTVRQICGDQRLTRSMQYNLPSSAPLPTFKLRSLFAFCIYVTLQYQQGSASLSEKTSSQLIDFGILCS